VNLEDVPVLDYERAKFRPAPMLIEVTNRAEIKLCRSRA